MVLPEISQICIVVLPEISQIFIAVLPEISKICIVAFREIKTARDESFTTVSWLLARQAHLVSRKAWPN